MVKFNNILTVLLWAFGLYFLFTETKEIAAFLWAMPAGAGAGTAIFKLTKK